MASLKYFESGPAPDFGPELVTQLKVLCPNIFLVCFRDKNKNVMVYQARVANGVLLDPPVESYWLNLEPSYRDSRRKKGIVHDREEQNFLDRRFAWGFESKRASDKECSFCFKNFNHPMTVKLTPKGAKLFAVKDGRKYFIRTLYVEASENIKLLNLKDNVKSLCVHGLDVTTKPYRPAKSYLKGGP
jgi:hypothetical protein